VVVSRRISHLRRTLVAISGVACLLAAAACGGGSQPASTVRWVVDWKADFSGPFRSGLDTRYWQYDTGVGFLKFGNGEIETDTNIPGNVELDGDGDLDITPVGQGTSWTSARVQTVQEFAPPAGGELEVTATIRQPDPAEGLGYWPAFWMLGSGEWPEHGEIDILEDVNALSEHSATLHCGDPTAGNPCHEGTGMSSGLQPCAGCQAGFHTYSVIIDRRDEADQQIRWYLDGREFFNVSESQVGAAAWTEAVDHGFTIILDVAMGGTYPDDTCSCKAPNGATTDGSPMIVRSLTVYDGVVTSS
jgi:beta-glucanase (GH16 family)